MNVLIDTNILIPLEDTSRVLNPLLAEMCQLLGRNKHVLYLHPVQKEDILRDKDKNRRDIALSRLNKYQIIPFPPELSENELLRYGWKQANDHVRIDHLPLHALCRGAVHFLITNDKGMHTKAKQAQIQEQVHRLDQFFAFLKSQTKDHKPPPYGIQRKLLYEFDVNQPFFDSLRDGYEGFNDWYKQKSGEFRSAGVLVMQVFYMLHVSTKNKIVLA